MTVALPYHFDTSRVWRMILTGAFAVEAVILAGALYGFLVRGDVALVLQLALCGAILAYFIRIFVRFQNGSVGTITADRVVVQPNVLYGIRLRGPHGTYPTRGFSSVRVELMSGATGYGDTLVQGGPHERIWLVGKEGTPDILIARTQREAGRALAKEFGVVLALPVEEKPEPY
jgi:hypothetical protein